MVKYHLLFPKQKFGFEFEVLTNQRCVGSSKSIPMIKVVPFHKFYCITSFTPTIDSARRFENCNP